MRPEEQRQDFLDEGLCPECYDKHKLRHVTIVDVLRHVWVCDECAKVFENRTRVKDPE